MLKNIISSCPLLEILEISYCTGNVYDPGYNDQLQFKVIEHRNLKQLTVRLYLSQRLILVEAPKLESLICTNHEDHLEDGDWIPCGLSLHSSQYQNLKMLHLCAVGITDDFFNNLEQKLPHLEDLLVLYCQGLRRIKISSQTLQRIRLAENYKLKEAHFDVPSIERLEYSCEKCEIIPEFSFTATKGHSISYIRIHWRGNVDSSWFLQLKKFLVNLIPSNIFLDIAIDGSIELDMNEIRNSVTVGEPQELQELSLSLSPNLDSSSILSALDCFFWICRPNSISQYWLDCCKNHKFIKLVFDMLMLRTNLDEYHKLQPIKGWQHDLIRQVKVQIYDCGVRLVGNAISVIKTGLVDEQLEALDWESILKALRTDGDMGRKIYFTLNWENHGMSKEITQMPKESKELIKES